MSVLGTLNGVGTGFSALGRGLFPALIGAAFSWGIEKGGSVVPAWWLLAALALLSIIPGYYIVEQDGPSRGDDVEEEEEEETDQEPESGVNGYGTTNVPKDTGRT